MSASQRTILYKYVPISPYFRANLLRALEKNSVFFSRKGNLNDPVDCEPHIDLALTDEDLIAKVKHTIAVSATNNQSSYNLRQVLDELQGETSLDEKYFQGILGLSKVSETRSLAGGGIGGTPIRQIAKEALREFSRHEISEPYIFSLSRTPTDALLWGHYAHGHSGVCIGYTGIQENEPTWVIGDVEYSNRRSSVTIDDVLAIAEHRRPSRSALHNVFFKKSESWRNEQEVRLVARPQSIQFGNVDLHLPEGAYISVPSLRVEEVIFGAKCSEVDRSAIKTIIQQKCTYDTWPLLRQARFAEDSYEITIDKSNEAFIEGTRPGPIPAHSGERNRGNARSYSR